MEVHEGLLNNSQDNLTHWLVSTQVARLTADEQTGGSSLLLGSSDSGAQRIATAARDARTPLQSKADDPIAQEARNAALERTLQTPLLGQHLCRNQISRRFSAYG